MTLQAQVDFSAPWEGQFIVVVCGYPGQTGDFCLAYRGPSSPSHAEQSDWDNANALFLSAGTPNPFVTATNLTYTIPNQQHAWVSLAVHDAAGGLVRTLINGIQTPGRHAVRWDGNRQDGSPAEAGVYFIQLTTGSASATRRTLLIR